MSPTTAHCHLQKSNKAHAKVALAGPFVPAAVSGHGEGEETVVVFQTKAEEGEV